VELLGETKMITWFRDLIFGKKYAEVNKPAAVEPQVTDAVTVPSPKKSVTNKAPVKKTTANKKTVSTKKKPVNRGRK
jgi:hypothetical protein